MSNYFRIENQCLLRFIHWLVSKAQILVILESGLTTATKPYRGASKIEIDAND